MNKQFVITLVRTIMTAFSAYVIGRNFLGNPVTSIWWEEAIAVVVTVISVAWGLWDKSTKLEGLQSGLRQVFAFAGGIIYAKGSMEPGIWQQVTGIVIDLATLIYSMTSKEKNAGIVAGKFTVVETNKGAVLKKTA